MLLNVKKKINREICIPPIRLPATCIIAEKIKLQNKSVKKENKYKHKNKSNNISNNNSKQIEESNRVTRRKRKKHKWK